MIPIPFLDWALPYSQGRVWWPISVFQCHPSPHPFITIIIALIIYDSSLPIELDLLEAESFISMHLQKVHSKHWVFFGKQITKWVILSILMGILLYMLTWLFTARLNEVIALVLHFYHLLFFTICSYSSFGLFKISYHYW